MFAVRDQKIDEARNYFRHKADAQKSADRRTMYQNLYEVAESTQEIMRLVEYLKLELEEVKKTLSLR